jgi:monoamine oxidase
LGKLLDVAYLIEYGSETRDLSSLELIYMLSSAEADSFSVFGESDEAWRVKGGNDQLPRAMANHLGLGSRVLLGWDFTAIRKESDGTYTLSFEVSGGGGAKEVRADYVVLAIPFTKLRTLDYARAGFDALKIEAITQQGGGRNGKLQLQFRKRLWNEQGPWGVSGGTSYSDTGSQLTWDPTRGQPGTSGIMVCYTGGERAAAAKLKHAYGNASDPNVLEDARTFLTQVEPLFPGLTAQWNGKASETLCHLDPRFYCSYSYWRVGQTQRFGGYERVPQGNVFFAGEHTSVDYLGFMEGAASEGVSAGQEMLALLPKRAPMPALPGRKHGRRGRGAAARQAPRQR